MVQRLLCSFIMLFNLLHVSPVLSEPIDMPGMNDDLQPLFDGNNPIADHVNILLKVVGTSGRIKPADSTLNPGNQFLMIPEYLVSAEFRPDLSFELDSFYLGVKPRATILWKQWDEMGLDTQDESSSDIFINEWLLRYTLKGDFIFSYGRENLQWGPSFLLSPSNPFFKNNGQSNPKKEIAGMDFARTVWVIDPSWTISAIANTDRGEQGETIDSISSPIPELHFPRYPGLYRWAGIDPDDISNRVTENLGFPVEFNRSYAVKADFSTFQQYFSLIGSYKEKDRSRLGFFGGMTVSDAMIVYLEGSFSQGTDALYPVKSPLSPFGSILMQTEDDSTALESLLLVGGSYTLDSGQTFVMEGVFNSAGYDNEEADLYYLLRQKASDAYGLDTPIGNLSRLALYQALDTRLRLLRKGYVMLQYQQAQIFNQINLIFRYTLNLDDYSSQLIPIVEYDLSHNIQLFLIGQHNFGCHNSEFRALADYGFTVGFEYTY
ncbi:MAG: hypothetical protein AB7S77_19580 [Desulfatirhabdiaceae bacterium]